MKMMNQYMYIYLKVILQTIQQKSGLQKNGGTIVANNKSNIPINDLKKILKVINDNYFLIIAKWKNYFEGQEPKFYC